MSCMRLETFFITKLISPDSRTRIREATQPYLQANAPVFVSLQIRVRESV